MIALGNLLLALGYILEAVLTIFIWIFIIRAVLSWFSPDPYNVLVRYLYGVTDPLLAKIRQKIPPLGMIDLSVLFVILGLIFLNIFVAGTLRDYGAQLKSSVMGLSQN